MNRIDFPVNLDDHGKYKSTLGYNGWYECKVIAEVTEGGRWIVVWEDGDKVDTLKEPRHLKKRSNSAELSDGGKGGKREDEYMETNIGESTV